MWFGHGTAGSKATAAPGSSVASQSEADRILALAYGALASLPAAQRRQAEAQYNNGTLPRLREAMAAWVRGTVLSRATFASRLFGRGADDPVTQSLYGAALGVVTATSHDGLRDAAGQLARAMQAVGIDRWPQFVADAQARARDPATQAAIENSRQPPGRDAIRPVYPLETLLPGLGAKRLADAARLLGGAVLRQTLPNHKSSGNSAPAEEGAVVGKPPRSPAPAPKQGGSDTAAAERPPISRQKQDGHIAGTPQNRNRLKQGTSTSTFNGTQAEADALTQEAWEKGTPTRDRPYVREYDFGRQIGTGPNGKGQSIVRVHQDSAGEIHGHPVGRKTS